MSSPLSSLLARQSTCAARSHCPTPHLRTPSSLQAAAPAHPRPSSAPAEAELVGNVGPVTSLAHVLGVEVEASVLSRWLGSRGQSSSEPERRAITVAGRPGAGSPADTPRSDTHSAWSKRPAAHQSGRMMRSKRRARRAWKWLSPCRTPHISYRATQTCPSCLRQRGRSGGT